MESAGRVYGTGVLFAAYSFYDAHRGDWFETVNIANCLRTSFGWPYYATLILWNAITTPI